MANASRASNKIWKKLIFLFKKSTGYALKKKFTIPYLKENNFQNIFT